MYPLSHSSTYVEPKSGRASVPAHVVQVIVETLEGDGGAGNVSVDVADRQAVIDGDLGRLLLVLLDAGREGLTNSARHVM